MTQLGEAILIAFLKSDNEKAKCAFKPDETTWKANLQGKSSRLRVSLKDNEPTRPASKADLSSSVFHAQAHHLIPHDHLREHAVHHWLQKGDAITGDTRYDVDHRNNGVWLPYAYHLPEWIPMAQAWQDATGAKLQANGDLKHEVMRKTRRQLHQGSHSETEDYGAGDAAYHEQVSKYLDKIRNNAASHYKLSPPCPDCEPKKDGKKLPPRDNTVRHVDKASAMLLRDIRRNRIFVSEAAARHFAGQRS